MSTEPMTPEQRSILEYLADLDRRGYVGKIMPDPDHPDVPDRCMIVPVPKEEEPTFVAETEEC